MTLNESETAKGHTDPTFKNIGENLYRHTPSGNYYALLKRGGKQFRRSLKTKDRTLANRRLADLRHKVANLTLSDTTNANFEALAKCWLDSVCHSLKPASVVRRRTCIKGLTKFFNAVPVRNITAVQCDRWLERRGKGLSASSFVQELDTLRLVLGFAVKRGLLLENPALSIRRRRVVTKMIAIPTREQFQAIIAAARDADEAFGTQGKGMDGADLLELLAYSGCRLHEATELRWQDVDFDRGCITVTGGEGGTKNHENRAVPMTPALRDLLKRLHEKKGPEGTALVSETKGARRCLASACRKLKLPHFTHHDLRHFFATTCIESGVDIPTISRWLGHKDGGALAMKVYGHLRQEHSFEMSKRVSFEAHPVSENIVALPKKAAD